MQAIVVNGASSAGCTSLVRRFCLRNDKRYTSVFMDEYLSELPSGMWENCSNTDQGWAEIGMAVNRHLAKLVESDKALVVNAFYQLQAPIENLFDLLGRDRVFFVQVSCDLSELERREQVRRNRRVGLARSQFRQIYAFEGYDLLLDSTALSVEEATQMLIKEVSNITA